ncbi:MAG: hypothetical protein JWQ83_237 [Lacunisphaera sp.]|nr:hypothetical protein [Lacunisphaera sp.]MDB6165097.1 hypothetical protein [Lacunisphaera sp.]
MKPVVTVELFYVLIGAIFAFIAGRIALDRRHGKRWGSALFWGLLAVTYLFGKVLSPVAVGYLVVVMVGLAAAHQVSRSEERGPSREERVRSAEFLGNRLFWPALVVPAVVVSVSLVLLFVPVTSFPWLEGKQVTLIALGSGALLAVAVALVTIKAGPATPLVEGSRLLQAIGWALILPQMLAALGGIFAKAGVGAVVAEIVTRALPTQIPFVAVAAYCGGMLLFTMCMGNAFAAFAVITGGIGLPLIVQQHHGNVAIMAAIGMLSGYCGTLMTPMAANFNIVPAMLLDLKDRNAVVKAQVPIALVIFAANVLLMYFCVYRF